MFRVLEGSSDWKICCVKSEKSCCVFLLSCQLPQPANSHKLKRRKERSMEHCRLYCLPFVWNRLLFIENTISSAASFLYFMYGHGGL